MVSAPSAQRLLPNNCGGNGSSVGGRNDRAGGCECALPCQVRLTHVQRIGVSQPGTDSGCPSLTQKLQIGAAAPAVARNKMALVALFKCTGVQTPRSSPIVHCAARGQATCASRARVRSCPRRRLCVSSAPVCSYCPRSPYCLKGRRGRRSSPAVPSDDM